MTAEIQAKIEAVKAPFQAVVEAADAIPALVDAAEQAAYDKGFAEGKVMGVQEGKDMIQLPSPTLPDGTVDKTLRYTQEQMDNAVRSGKAQQAAEDQLIIDDLKTQLADKGAAMAAKDQEKIDALAAQRADFIAKIQNFEANEDQSMRDLMASV